MRFKRNNRLKFAIYLAILLVASTCCVYLSETSSSSEIIDQTQSLESKAFPTYSWLATWSRYDNRGDTAYALALDSTGNIYITGESNNGTMMDHFIAKFDAGGNLLWNDTYDGGDGDNSRGIAIRGNDIYVSGSYLNTTLGYNQIHLLKYTGTTLMWRKSWGRSGATHSICTDMVMDASGNLYLVGFVDSGNYDGIILKMDSSGNEVWNATFTDSSPHSDMCEAVTLVGNNLYVGGKTGSFGVANEDGFLACYDPTTGDHKWNLTWDGIYLLDGTYGIALDQQGNFYVAGYSDAANMSAAAFIRKYDATRNSVWNRTYKGLGSTRAKDLLIYENVLYIVGSTEEPMGVLPDLFLLKYDLDGNSIETWTWDGQYSGSDSGEALLIDGKGNLYITGRTEGSVALTDAFLMKIAISAPSHGGILVIILIILAPVGVVIVLRFITRDKKGK